MHASKGRKYYACTEKRSQKRREIMVTITRRDLCRLALLSLMVAFDGRSYSTALGPGPGSPGAGIAGASGAVLTSVSSFFVSIFALLAYI